MPSSQRPQEPAHQQCTGCKEEDWKSFSDGTALAILRVHKAVDSGAQKVAFNRCNIGKRRAV